VKRRSGLIAASAWTASTLAAFGSSSSIAADRPPTVGLLSINRPEVAKPAVERLLEQMRAAGLVEGRDFEFDGRYASGDPGRLDALAEELVRAKPAVIIAGFGSIPALTRATTTIPIVMWGVSNPVEAGLVASLSNPGGNLTGVISNPPEIGAKMIEMLKIAAPQVSRIALVWNPVAQGMLQFKGEVERGARLARVAVSYVDLRQPADYRPELLDAARPDALYVAWDATVAAIAPRLIDYAAARRLPSIGVLRQFVEMGGLMSLGPDPKEPTAVVARLAGRILKGASPATLPIEQPVGYELIVNRRTADAIGLRLPRELLLRASEVIER
jgi:putative ABC transport system substrate-binding protein